MPAAARRPLRTRDTCLPDDGASRSPGLGLLDRHAG